MKIIAWKNKTLSICFQNTATKTNKTNANQNLVLTLLLQLASQPNRSTSLAGNFKILYPANNVS